jgi:glycosyltransferase involved in cell wall biosynthesis
VSKGVIMPTFGIQATRLARQADVIHLHLPQFDAPGLALRGLLFGKPVVLTYHCDLQLPEGLFNRIVNGVVLFMNRVAGDLSDAVVTYTRDYGANSPYLSRYLGSKLHIIPPPVELASCSHNLAQDFEQRHDLEGKKVIGISARIAAEKGIEVLFKALPIILDAHPDAYVLHASPQTIGEDAYALSLAPLMEKHGDHYQQLGALHGAELTAFYKNLDVLVIPSLNSTESFGLVQIEAMVNGVPVVSSNLPGVRQPVTMTGMGEVVPIGDHESLAQGVIKVLDNRVRYLRSVELIAESFSPRQTAIEYVHLFEELLQGHHNDAAEEPEAYERLREMNQDAGT